MWKIYEGRDDVNEQSVVSKTAGDVKVLFGEILCRDPEEFCDSQRLIEDLAMDSLELLDMAMALEDRYGIVLETDDVFRLNTVGDVAALLTARIV